EFGAGILTANNQSDLALALQIIEQLRKHLEEQGATAGPELEIVELQFGDAAELSALVNQLGTRATGQNLQRAGQPGGFPGFGGPAAQQQQGVGGSVLLLPLSRQNAILLFGSKLRFPYYKNLIKQFDIRNTNLPVPFALQKASAQQVATMLSQIYQQ